MAYNAHSPNQPELIAQAGVRALSEKTDILSLFHREQWDHFHTEQGDVVALNVEGTLPFRKFGNFGENRNRRKPIEVDRYTETRVLIEVNRDDAYQAVELTDEDMHFEFGGSFGKLVEKQTDAIAEGLQEEALGRVKGLPFEYQLGINTSPEVIKAQRELGRDPYLNSFIEADKSLRKMRSPINHRVALVGFDVAAELKKNQRLTFAEGRGIGALGGDLIGSYGNFTFVEDYNLEANEALILDSSALAFWNHAPAVPQGAKFGAVASHGSLAMRWIVDYDPLYAVDRSIWYTWYGFREVTDYLSQMNEDKSQRVNGTQDYFLRGVKLVFDTQSGADEKIDALSFAPGDGGSDSNRKGASPDSELGRVYNGLPFDGIRPEAPSAPLTLRNLARFLEGQGYDLSEIAQHQSAEAGGISYEGVEAEGEDEGAEEEVGDESGN